MPVPAKRAPVPKGVGGELGAVVAADEGGSPSLFDEAVENGHRPIGVDGVGDEVRERLPGELVGDVQDLQGPARRGDVELVVEGPDVVGVRGLEPVRRRGGDPEARPLVAPGRDPQALFTPQALDFLAVEVVPLAAQDGMSPAIAPAGMVAGEVPQTPAQVSVGVGISGAVALGRAVLTHDLARPPLRETKSLLKYVSGLAALRRAHHFPEAISRRATISSSLSATIRFRAGRSPSRAP